MKLYHFPADPSRRDAWVRAIRRDNWMPTEYSMICQLHFISGQPSRFSNSPDYVPSKFTFRPASTARQSDKVLRYERLQRRRKRAQITEEVTTDSSDEYQPDIQIPDQPDQL